MPLQVRRVVTSHDGAGNFVVSSDEILTAATSPFGASISTCEIWSTDRMPVDNSAAALPGQKAGFVNRDEDKRNNYVRGGGGTVIRIIEYGPDNPRYAHRNRDG
jgi:hypothetical protein